LRTKFKSTGIAWTAPEAKAAFEVRGELEELGLVRCLRKKSSRTLGHLLTPAGEWVARAAAGLPTMADSMEALEQLWTLRTHRTGWDSPDTHWAPETILAGADYGKTTDRDERLKLIAFEERLLPVLIRGWATSTSDCHGRVFYGVPQTLMDSPRIHFKVSAPPQMLPQFDEEWRALYYDEIKVALGALCNPPPDPRDIGMIPASCSPSLRWKEVLA
jgi:hypothetical protein